MSITVTTSAGRQSSVRVAVGSLIYAGAFTNDSHAKAASKRLGVPADFLDQAVARFREDGTTEHIYTPPRDAEAPAEQYPDTFKVRLLTQPVAEAVEYDTFAEALAHAGATTDHVIEWEDDTQVACLDWDWHTAPTNPLEGPPEDILAFPLMATPRPTYAWKTRSGGLRMVYLKQGELPASALAAVAAFSLYKRLTPQGLELKTQTRFPANQEDILTLAGDSDIESVRQTFDVNVFDPNARDDYLSEWGLQVGQRYPHDKCPIDNSRTSQSPNPVQVLNDGIKCYSCEGHGIPSFRSWSQLSGKTIRTEVSVCVKNFTHWDHARFVIEKHVDLPPGLHEAFYRAALIVCHGVEDARIASVFRPRDLVRYSGYWGTLSAQIRRDDKLRATIAGLPAVLGPDGKSDPERHERFLDSADLDRWGYYPLKRVYGMKLSTRYHDSPDGRPRIAVVKGLAPEYLDEAARSTEEAAWSLIEAAYPGVRRNLIELLVFSRGVVEFGAVNAPMFLFEGASGSGKTGSPHLAAAICGDECTDVVPQEDEDRLYSKIIDAIHHRGTFISISEVVKAARKFRQQPRDYVNFLLQMSPQTVGWILYKGPVAFGDVPVLCISDTEFTEEILGDAQLGRRLLYCDLGTEFNDWKGQSAAAGLAHPWAIRSVEEYRHAADSLLSIWIDRYWRDRDEPASLDEVAKSLGIGYLNTRSATNDRTELMSRLFDEWKKYAGATGSYRERQSKGFKAFKIDPDKVALARVWVQLHDEGSPTTWSRANERSWQAATGHSKPLKLVVKRLYDDRENWVQLSFQEQKGNAWNAIV